MLTTKPAIQTKSMVGARRRSVQRNKNGSPDTSPKETRSKERKKKSLRKQPSGYPKIGLKYHRRASVSEQVSRFRRIQRGETTSTRQDQGGMKGCCAQPDFAKRQTPKPRPLSRISQSDACPRRGSAGLM